MIKLPFRFGFRKRIFLFRHRGTRYTCPFCGYRSDILGPFGHYSEVSRRLHIVGGGRRNVSCLKCESHDRERLIFVYLKYVAKIFDRDNLSLLHVAPEPRLSRKILKHKHIRYVCGDLFTPGYKYPSYVRNMNILHLNIPDNSFDVILCNHVLEHIPDDHKAISELFRVLKPGGFALLQVPISYHISVTMEDFSITDPHERLLVFGQSDHCRLYGPDYVDRLCACGFRVQPVSISADYPQYALNPEEKLFVCTK